MKIRKKTLAFLSVLLLLNSCKEQHEVTPATYSLLLTGDTEKSWQQTSFTFIFDDTEVDPIDANRIYGIPDCALDDIYKFVREGKQLEIYDGNNKCNPDNDDLLVRTSWDIVNANANLFLGGGQPYILAKLTNDSLVYGFRDTLIAPVADATFWEFPGVAQWVYQPSN
jgi:hypothetical protein